MKKGFLMSDGHQTEVFVSCTETVLERMRGLLWSSPLPVNSGLWISPCNSVHTCFMSYSIDVIFLSKDGVIRKIRQNLKPWSMAACWGTAAVLELRSGSASLAGLRVGSRLSVVFNGIAQSKGALS